MTNKDNGGINLLNWNKRRAQIIVTYDCNMNCSFCINYSLGQKKKGFIKVSDVVYFLNYLKYVEKLDDAIIVFLGGEPTLIQNQVLREICNLCHEMGYKTEIYTNGTSKEKLLELDSYVDYITISNYIDYLIDAFMINKVQRYNIDIYPEPHDTNRHRLPFDRYQFFPINNEPHTTHRPWHRWPGIWLPGTFCIFQASIQPWQNLQENLSWLLRYYNHP